MKTLATAFTVTLFALSSLPAQTTESTPSKDSQELSSKQIDQSITELKDAINGMKSAIGKGDRASFKLYRLQAKQALVELDKLGGAEVNAQSKTEAQAVKEGKMEHSPTPTPTPMPTPTPTLNPDTTPVPTPDTTPTP
jgi:hypothetical protein